MPFNINNIKSNLQFGGARPTLFDVIITAPVGIADANTSIEKLRFTCKAASIPAQTIQAIDVPFMGRKVKYAGNRTFDDWNVTILNDEDWVTRNAMERWNNAINTHENNLRENGATSQPLSYKGTAIVTQYGKDGRLLQQYRFEGIFPTVVAPIELDWNSTDQIQEFQVTFAYDLWKREPGIL